MKRYRYKQHQVIEALQRSNGLVTQAAKILGCNYHTVQNYINNFKAIKAAHVACREKLGDLAEHNLVKAMINEDIGVSQWYLKHHRQPYKNPTEIEITGKLVIGLPESMGDMDGKS